MSVTINFSKNTSAPWQSNANMLKSTREKIQRQEERDGKIAFFETQKQNLKNQKADTIEEIAKKLEKFHTYEDEIAAAKQEYNSSQMFHILDEAEERGEQMAKAAEKYKPKTEEEQKRRLKARQQEQTAKPMIRVFYPKLWMICRNQSMRRKEIWKLLDSFQKQSYSRNCPMRNCRKNNRDISRLTCGHNKSRYFTDACLG